MTRSEANYKQIMDLIVQNIFSLKASVHELEKKIEYIKESQHDFSRRIKEVERSIE